MKQIIDAEPVIANWTVSGTQSKSDVETPEYVAGVTTSKSLIVSFKGPSDFAERTFGTPVDVLNKDYLVFSVWSQRFKGKRYSHSDDFNYAVQLQTGGTWFRFPTWDTFTEVVIDISDINQIDHIRIEPVKDFTNEDNLIVSYFVTCKVDYPYDIMEGVKDHLTAIRDQVNSNGGFKAGTVSGAAGDDKIKIEGLILYVERYSVVTIDDGVNSEKHLLQNNNETDFNLGQLYDGPVLLNSYTNADVYVSYEPIFGKFEEEVVVPSMTIWGFAPASSVTVLPSSRMVREYGGGSFMELESGMRLEFPMQIDLMARQWELIEQMGDIVRRFLRERHVWINGRKHDFIWTGNAESTFPDDPTVQLYSITYTVTIEVKESGVVKLPVSGAATLDVKVL